MSLCRCGHKLVTMLLITMLRHQGKIKNRFFIPLHIHWGAIPSSGITPPLFSQEKVFGGPSMLYSTRYHNYSNHKYFSTISSSLFMLSQKADMFMSDSDCKGGKIQLSFPILTGGQCYIALIRGGAKYKSSIWFWQK